MSFIVISYYTVETEYVRVAHDFLMASLKGKDIRSDIRGVENLQSWAANTSFKPTFILQMLEKHKEDNVVFIDADGEVLEYPKLFDEIPLQHNFASHTLDRGEWYANNETRMELLTGTLWVRNCTRSKEVIKEWADECAKTKNWEQRVLEQVLYKNKEVVYPLPVEYCWIKTLPSGNSPNIKPKGNIIVRHNQVSRSLKKQIK